ncbi:MAG: hypothetical protein IM466_02525 [Microcystis sp. M04BS1]|nr:hypothetical protein [Microcystis sp. M04BS1]
MEIDNSIKQSRIFSDRPVLDLTRNLLWNDGDVVKAQVDSIAQRIAEAVLVPENSIDRSSALPDSWKILHNTNSLTFAVHGPWGAGKTSFIKMVLNRTRDILGTDQERLLECYYQASAFDGTTLGAKASLCLQVLLTLANGDKKRAIKIFKEQFDPSFNENDPTSIENVYREFEDGRITIGNLIALQSQYLEDIAKLNTLTDFCEIINTELSPRGITQPGLQRTLVVVVDDLDRCSREFIASLLEVIQQWSGLDRLYFILAIDREILNNAISSRYRIGDSSTPVKISPEVALEKYVQYSVEVPELNEAQVNAFIKGFLEPFEDPLVSLFKENSDLFARGIRVRTPRGIKKCLNTISPSLSQLLQDRSTQEIQDPKNFRYQLKERLLEYTWRNFYKNFYLRGKDKQNQFTLALVAIERAAFEYEGLGEDSEQLEFSLNRIRSRLNISSEVIPSDLEFVRFLALKPWFSLTDEILKRSSLQLILSGIIPADQTEERFISAQEILAQKPPIKQLEEYSRVARDAIGANDFQTTIDCALKSLQLAQSQPNAFTPSEVADFGNLGLYAERITAATENPEVQKVAFALFQTAYRVNPSHTNNRLNFVSFILDAKYPKLDDLYPFCTEILEDQNLYEESGQFSRYLDYKARLEFLGHGENSGWKTWIEKLVDLIEGGRESNTAFSRLTTFYSDVNDSLDKEPLKRAARIYIPRVSGQDRELAMLAYADRLDKNTQDSEHPEVIEAFEIYKYILRPIEEGGIKDTPENFYRGNAFHNFAVGLHRVGYLEAAGHYWYQSYLLLRGKETGNLIPAYSAYLKDKCNRPDLAELVMRQEVLPEEVVAQQNDKTMPENFVDGGIQSIFDI